MYIYDHSNMKETMTSTVQSQYDIKGTVLVIYSTVDNIYYHYQRRLLYLKGNYCKKMKEINTTP